jgi:hypothetical protein
MNPTDSKVSARAQTRRFLSFFLFSSFISKVCLAELHATFTAAAGV